MSLQIASKRKADRNTYGDIIGENASRLKISKKSKVEIGKNKNNRVVFEIQSEQVITIEDDEREEIRGEIQEEIIIVMNDMFSIPLSVLKKMFFCTEICDIVRFGMTCKRMYELLFVGRNRNALWRNIFEQRKILHIPAYIFGTRSNLKKFITKQGRQEIFDKPRIAGYAEDVWRYIRKCNEEIIIEMSEDLNLCKPAAICKFEERKGEGKPTFTSIKDWSIFDIREYDSVSQWLFDNLDQEKKHYLTMDTIYENTMINFTNHKSANAKIPLSVLRNKLL